MYFYRKSKEFVDHEITTRYKGNVFLTGVKWSVSFKPSYLRKGFQGIQGILWYFAETGWGRVCSLLGLNRYWLEEGEILAKLQILSKFTFLHSNSCSTPTWYLVPDIWHLVSSTWYLLPGTHKHACATARTCAKTPGTLYLIPGTWFLVPVTHKYACATAGTCTKTPGYQW